MPGLWERAPNQDFQQLIPCSLPAADTETRREESGMFYWMPGDGERSGQGTAHGHFLASSSLERVLMISSFLACSRSSRRFRASLVLERRASAWSLRGRGVRSAPGAPQQPQNSPTTVPHLPGVLLSHTGTAPLPTSRQQPHTIPPHPGVFHSSGPGGAQLPPGAVLRPRVFAEAQSEDIQLFPHQGHSGI